MLPFAVLFLSLGIDVNATTMLLAFVPGTDVFATIRPFESTVTLLHIVDIVSDIATTVGPSEGSVALHLVIPPLTREYSSVSPFINACSVNVIIIEITGVSAVVSPCEFALAMLLSLKILSLV
jgi:hypothetical protein